MWKLKRFLGQYKKQVLLGPLFKWVEAVLELIVPLVMASLIDVGVTGRDSGYIFKMGALLLLIAAVSLGCALICQYFASVASQGVGTNLRREMFAKINSLSHAELDRFGTHSLITRITNDVNQLQLAVAMLIRLVVRAPFLAVGAVVMAFTVDVQLSLIFVIAFPLIVLVLYVVMSKSVPFFRVMQKKLDRISLITRENLEGARVIRAFSKQKEELSRFTGASDDLADTAVRVGRLSALLNPLTSIIMNAGVAAILWFGGFQVDAGRLSQGEIVALVNYMNQILLALTVVANLVVIFTKASASAARVNAVLETEPSVADSAAAEVRPDPDAPVLCFENVSFAYAGSEEPSLEGVTLTLRRGETLGVIGGTGAGKSTFVNLIPRFYDATGGNLKICGRDIREYPLAQLRRMISVVPQKAAVVSGTIADNLRWRKGNASEEELWAALRTAQAADFVGALPKQLQSYVEQGGKNFSGGQKQRLTIARALVGEPEVLILDDSSSALDFATDAALRKALREDTRGMTVVIVSQRASAVRRADRILVLDNGEMAGLGTHEELLQSCPVYKEICLSQMSAEEVSK
ncbi:MAG TPA: ABC transporter ATP-binding protein [Candidatus Merdivicinus intestinavium]|nr:ABC transporter ATP-binding protein [Candidatus Merdivicinus intestinavium]